MLEWARARCQSGRITAALDEFLESPDAEHRKWAIGIGMSYGIGLPSKRPEPQPTDIGALIREAAKRMAEREEELQAKPGQSVDQKPALARPPIPLISAGSDGPEGGSGHRPPTPDAVVSPAPPGATETEDSAAAVWPSAALERLRPLRVEWDRGGEK